MEVLSETKISPPQIRIGQEIRDKIHAMLQSARAIYQSNGAEALKLADEALVLSITNEYDKGIAESNAVRGLTYFILNKVAEGEAASTTALAMFREIRDLPNEARTLNTLGTHYEHVGEYTKAIQHFDEARAIAVSILDENIEAEALYKSGVTYYRYADYANSLESLLKSYNIYSRIGDKRGQANVLNNMGSLYARRGEYDEAKRCLDEGLEIGNALNAHGLVVALLNNVGMMYMMRGNTPKARDYFMQSVEIANATGNQGLSVQNLLNLCTINFDSGDLAGAEQYALRALGITREYGYPQQEMDALGELGKVHHAQGLLDEAETAFRDALVIGSRIDVPGSESWIRESLAYLYEAKGDTASALEHFKRFHWLKERMVNDTNERAVRNMLLRFQLERSKIESEEVRRANTELTRALEKEESLNRTLEQMNKEKSDLIGIVAHDLRDPIASIKMLSGLLQDRTLPPEEVPQFVTAIQAASTRALELISSLLSMNAVESGNVKYTFEQFAPVVAIEHVLAQFAKQAAEKTITVKRRLPSATAMFFTDKNALREIVENLISNAVKYTPRGGTVCLACDVNKETFRLSVRNEGAGLTAEDRTKLFQKFSRLSASPTAGEPSSGLGLFIVKKIVDALHGKIWCESTPGEGAEFIVELPARQNL